MSAGSTSPPPVALVTGGARRVGAGIVRRLAAAPFRVLVHHNASSSQADCLVREVRGAGGEADAIRADLSRRKGAEELAAAVREAAARVDLLVNNASVWYPTPIDRIDPEELDRIWAVNLRSPFLLSVLLGNWMRTTGGGAIVNILDWSLDRPDPDHVPYAISKAGLAAATRGLARALAPEVRVNGIAPGAVLLAVGTTERQRREIERAVPMGRVGTPEDVAEAALYLARARYVTGAILPVDGGRLTR